MATSNPVLVIGGTHGTGLLIAQQLARRGDPVRVLARDPARAASVLPPAIEIVAGDLTVAATLPAVVEGVSHIIFTAGCRSGYPARERKIIATEYQGVVATLDAARGAGFKGRFLYMTASGVLTRSFWSVALNLWKGNTLEWRRRAEGDIRSSGLDYTVIRAGFLVNRPIGLRAIQITQRPLPLSPRHRIARADVAEAFIAALDHPRTSRTTFEVIWGEGLRGPDWTSQLDRLVPDDRFDSSPKASRG